MSRVTIRPGLPGHVLFFGPGPGERAGFPKIGCMAGFRTFEPSDHSKFLKANTNVVILCMSL